MKKRLRAPHRIKGKRIYLRGLRASDATHRYAGWMNDAAVNRYLENRLTRHSVKSIRRYITAIQRGGQDLFLAIVLKDGDRHIGNIKLGPIDPYHRSGTIGLLIGDTSCWGRGYATEAIRLISDYAFRTLKLHRLAAGIYANNTGSLKAFLKAGWIKESTERKSRRYGSRYIDLFRMARLNPKET